MPRAIFDYADRGSYDEVTFNRNLADLAPSSCASASWSTCRSSSSPPPILGEDWAIPLGIGPTGLTGLFHANGEMLGARAAQAFGVPFCLSTMSICSIEDVRSAVQKPFWFQVYLMRDRGFNVELLDRAKAANCSAIMLTVDMPVQGLRRRDPKNGLSIPPRLTLKNMFEVAMQPTWALKVLTGRRRTFGNLEGRMKGRVRPQDAVRVDRAAVRSHGHLERSRLAARAVAAQDHHQGHPRSRRCALACEVGADAMVVSNHGGRQLDGARSTISALPEIVDAVQGRCEVLFDGGVRTGQDVLKALALGAKGCLIGKAFLYALAARAKRAWRSRSTSSARNSPSASR